MWEECELVTIGKVYHIINRENISTYIRYIPFFIILLISFTESQSSTNNPQKNQYNNIDSKEIVMSSPRK